MGALKGKAASVADGGGKGIGRAAGTDSAHRPAVPGSRGRAAQRYSRAASSSIRATDSRISK